MGKKLLALALTAGALTIPASSAMADPDFGPGNSSQGPNDGGAQCHEQQKVPQARAGDEQQRNRDAGDHHHRTEVRLGEQQIEGAVLTEDVARRLGARAGDPALRLTRHYFVTGRRLIEMSISLHPADRFSYAMTIMRDVSA